MDGCAYHKLHDGKVPFLLNQRKRENGHRNLFMTKSPQKNVPSSIPTSGTFFRGDLVMKKFLGPFSLFRGFKKSSCQLLSKECALSTSKLPRKLAQEQCG